jgi:hypothetical protein
MNIFFYPASVSKHSKPYFQALQSCITAKELIFLPSGRGLTSPPCLNLRSGDILIIYVEDDDALENLLTIQNDLKNFRILLILSPDISRLHRDSAYKLSPIFIAVPDDFTELSTIVMNILLRNVD